MAIRVVEQDASRGAELLAGGDGGGDGAAAAGVFVLGRLGDDLVGLQNRSGIADAVDELFRG